MAKPRRRSAARVLLSSTLVLVLSSELVSQCRVDDPQGTPPASPRTERAYFGRVPLPSSPDFLSGELWIPSGLRKVDAVVVVLKLGVDLYVFDNRDIRAACSRLGCAMMRVEFPSANPGSDVPTQFVIDGVETTVGDAIQALVGQFARTTRRPELARAGLVFWGMSRMGGFAGRLAAWRPERVIGFISYHGVPGEKYRTPAFWQKVRNIPSLVLTGGGDTPGRQEMARRFVDEGRRLDAPWTHGVQSGATHSSVDALLGDVPLMVRWLEATIPVRVSPRGLRAVDSKTSGYIGRATGPVVRVGTFRNDPSGSSWLPSREVAFTWMSMRGACNALSREEIDTVIGSPTRVVSDWGSLQPVCEFAPVSARDAAIRLTIRFSFVQGGPRGIFEQQPGCDVFTDPPPDATPIRDWRWPGYTRIDPDRACTSVTAILGRDNVRISLCDRNTPHGHVVGVGVLTKLLERLLGEV